MILEPSDSSTLPQSDIYAEEVCFMTHCGGVEDREVIQ